MRRVSAGSRRVCRWFLAGSGPLKRGTDRIEMALRLFLLLAVLLAAPAGTLTGLAVHRHDAAIAAQQARTRHQVEAVVVSAPVVPDGATPDQEALTTVAWADADGKQRTATAAVPVTARVSDPVTIWLTADGHITSPPLDAAAARGNAVWAGVLAGLATVLVGALVQAGGRRLLDTRRSRQWEADWQAVEPVWTSRRR